MARTVQLLLVSNVENLGIVGDIVKVKTGYARNYLLPHGHAEFPTPSKIEALKEARAAAQAELGRLRSAREELLERMQEISITLVRSCNDKGILYGSVTQRDIADGLQEAGYDVGVRSIRLPNALRHIGEYPVPIQFDKDLRTEVALIIEPDQPLEEREEMEFDDEGNLIEKPKKAPPTKAEEKPEGEGEATPEPAEAS
jgi:large subunit ribosomal protein L9